ncbi:hypothetical protein [Chamaesiphon sp. OTE_8_metabat_110]|uniref:hypothetical protein n=1 Tax=Chamaesiphon sp. OTE_8_metabat_110 TaxID=2964696 RepID=UPI002869F55F|nr:hypothetical protein [Chamaesiphon sp. OTE_8_metabat_110]
MLAKPLSRGASLSPGAAPVGVAAGGKLVLPNAYRCLRQYRTIAEESYYILTPIWFDRRVRSTICDTVIGLSAWGSLDAIR